MDIEFVLRSVVATVSNRRRPYTTVPSTAIIPALCQVYPKEQTISRLLVLLKLLKSVLPQMTSPNDVDKKLIPAFLGNDPDYPWPDVDEDLWREFSAVYWKRVVVGVCDLWSGEEREPWSVNNSRNEKWSSSRWEVVRSTGRQMVDLSNGRAALYKYTSEGDTPSYN